MFLITALGLSIPVLKNKVADSGAMGRTQATSFFNALCYLVHEVALTILQEGKYHSPCQKKGETVLSSDMQQSKRKTIIEDSCSVR